MVAETPFPEASPPWRPQLLDALRLLGRLSEALVARGLPTPILVGGGAVEFYSGSEIMTGDIDLTSPVQPELEEELQRLGFQRPAGPGHSMSGWLHPALALGFEVVARAPFGGASDPARLRLVDAHSDGARFRVLAVEDLIADRMGQYASGSAPEMLEQARVLLGLYPDADREYLERRVREETIGAYGTEDIAS